MEKIEEKLWRRVDKWVWLFQIVPFVRMVAVCNSLSFGIADERSDIDIFIVTRRNRVFVSWAFANLFLKFFKVRTYGEDVAGKFCLSFFVEEGGMNLNEIALKDDVYLAYWIWKLVPIVDRGVAYKFLHRNKWALSVLKEEKFEVSLARVKKENCLFLVRKFMELFYIGFIGDFFNKLVGGRLSSRLGSRPGGRSGGRKSMIKLHRDDRRVFFRGIYRGRISRGCGFDEGVFLAILKDSRESSRK